MREFAYLQQIEKYRRHYEAFPLPVIICDRTLLVYWANPCARQQAACFTAPSGLEAVMKQQPLAQMWDELEQSGSFVVPVLSAEEYRAAVLLPVQDRQQRVVLGAVVLLFREEVSTSEGLAAGMAHALGRSLREGVGGIFNMMDDMAAKADLLKAGWVHSGLNRIGVEGYRLLRAADNISEYARFYGGDAVLALHALDLAEYIEEISETVAEIGHMAGIPVDITLSERICPVSVDRASFEVALFNLIHNSLYFTRSGNRIVVAIERERNVVRLAVTDRGIGIPEEQLKTVWAPYTTYGHGGRGAGIGLGLSVVSQVMRAHGGSADLRSLSGEGTVVTMCLPTASITNPIRLRQEAVHRRLDDRFSRLYIGLTDAIESPYRNE